MVAWGTGTKGWGMSEQGHEGMFWGEGNVVDLDWGDGIHLSKLTMNVFSCIYIIPQLNR